MTRRNHFDRLRMLRRAIRPLEVFQIRAFGRSVVSTVARTPVLVLHTTGRRTGQARLTPLAFHRIGDDVVVIGGAGGQARTPDWVANLRSDPSVEVTINGTRTGATATELTGAQRDRLWEELTSVWPRIVVYERRSGRPIPVFWFTPTVTPDDVSGNA